MSEKGALYNPSDEDLIRHIYTLVLGPERFDEVIDALRDRIASGDSIDLPIFSADHEEAANLFDGLHLHFENVLSLMEAQGRRFDTERSTIKALDSNPQPMLLMHADGRVYHANSSAVDLLDVGVGETLSPDRFDPGHHRDFTALLRKIEDHELNTIVKIVSLMSSDETQHIQFALTRTYALTGEPLGLLSTINISWVPSVGDHFRAVFALSPVELQITKTIVTGGTLQDLADRRGTSVGTVRNQAKSLLRKLNVKTQTELACLYSGFAQFQTELHVASKTRELGGHSHQVFLTGDNRIMNYEDVGSKRGHPVIFFPALLGGSVLSDDMLAAINSNKIRLISVWRAGFSNSSPNELKGLSAISRHAADCADLIKSLGLKKVSLLGHITTSSYALAFAKNHAELCDQIVIVNGVVPTGSGPHLKQLDRDERLRVFLARYAPKLGLTVLHAYLRRIDAGFDEGAMRRHLKDSPEDQHTLGNEMLKARFRADYAMATLNGYKGYENEFLNMVSDWQSLFKDLTVQIKWRVAKHNKTYTPSILRLFFSILSEADRERFDLNVIEGAGHLLLYQKPDLIFSELVSSCD